MEQDQLFAPEQSQTSNADTQKTPTNAHVPLAERLRPQTLSDAIGQEHLIGPEGRLSKMLEKGQLPSIILWGPPGCGKTTIARLLAAEIDFPFKSISAIYSGVAELKKIFTPLEQQRQYGQTTKPLVLFVDEIHRFNKAQQDAFLPHVESGLIILIGATTENPSFSLNSAILSRCSVETLQRLSHDALNDIYETSISFLDTPLNLTDNAKNHLLQMADGDARYLLNMVERLSQSQETDDIDVERLSDLISSRSPIYDSNEEAHYNLISALHKSVRGSDPDAALYWFSRMLDGGEDLQFLARRILRMASEDIGLAAPQALSICLNAWQSYERLGSPEGELALAQAIIYLATAPKSNAVYTAYKTSRRAAREHGSLMPPAHILNAPTKMMKELGYGDGYIYDHDAAHGVSGQNYFPDDYPRERFYAPKNVGFEASLKDRLQKIEQIRYEYSKKNKDD